MGMSSKLIHQQKDLFSKMVVQAVMMLDAQTLPLNMIGIKKVQGGALEDTLLVDGVAFKKTFSNCEGQRYYCCLRGNLPPAQCGRDREEPQVGTGCRPDGRWYARRDGQGKGKTNVNTSPKTAAALISACLVS